MKKLKRREGYVQVGEDFVEEPIVPSPKAMKKFWEIPLPEAIEMAKKRKQEEMKNKSEDISDGKMV